MTSLTGRRTALFFHASLFVSIFAAAPAAAPGPDVKNRAAPKTVITGSRMNLLDKGDAVEFVGGVKVVRGHDTLTADRVLSEEKKGLVRAWGNVHLRRDVPEENVRWESWSQEGAYDTDISSGTLWNRTSRVRVKRSPLTAADRSELELKAGRVTFFRSTEPRPSAAMGWPLVSTAALSASTGTFAGMEAQGDVYVLSVEISTAAPRRKTEIWATEAFFDGRARRTVFWNQAGPKGPFPYPHAHQEEGAAVRKLRGGILVYHLDEKRLAVHGRVSAQMWEPDDAARSSRKEGR